MFFKEPKSDKRISWTRHVKEKMRFYQLSERRLKKVLRNPDRKEKGIAPQTIAVMQRAGSKKHPYEIWLMYQTVSQKSQPTAGQPKAGKIKSPASAKATVGRQNLIKIISAWRYPGISPVGEPIPIPEDIAEELKEILK